MFILLYNENNVINYIIKIDINLFLVGLKLNSVDLFLFLMFLLFNLVFNNKCLKEKEKRYDILYFISNNII